MVPREVMVNFRGELCGVIEGLADIIVSKLITKS